MESESKEVRGVFLGGVEVADLVVAAANNVIVADYDAGDGGKKDRVGGKVGCEVIGGRKEVPEGYYQHTIHQLDRGVSGDDAPWAHRQTNYCANITATTDVEVAGQQCSHVCTC